MLRYNSRRMIPATVFLSLFVNIIGVLWVDRKKTVMV